jgi:hypothetical protein
MSFFAKASVTDYKEYTTPDGEGFIRLRKELSKQDVNGLYKDSPRGEDDRVGMVSFSEKLVEKLIVGWSNTDPDGNAVEFGIKEFRALNAQAAQWIEKTVGQHFRDITGTEAEDLEKKD